MTRQIQAIQHIRDC